MDDNNFEQRLDNLCLVKTEQKTELNLLKTKLKVEEENMEHIRRQKYPCIFQHDTNTFTSFEDANRARGDKGGSIHAVETRNYFFETMYGDEPRIVDTELDEQVKDSVVYLSWLKEKIREYSDLLCNTRAVINELYQDKYEYVFYILGTRSGENWHDQKLGLFTDFNTGKQILTVHFVKNEEYKPWNFTLEVVESKNMDFNQEIDTCPPFDPKQGYFWYRSS